MVGQFSVPPVLGISTGTSVVQNKCGGDRVRICSAVNYDRIKHPLSYLHVSAMIFSFPLALAAAVEINFDIDAPAQRMPNGSIECDKWQFVKHPSSSSYRLSQSICVWPTYLLNGSAKIEIEFCGWRSCIRQWGSDQCSAVTKVTASTLTMLYCYQFSVLFCHLFHFCRLFQSV